MFNRPGDILSALDEFIKDVYIMGTVWFLHLYMRSLTFRPSLDLEEYRETLVNIKLYPQLLVPYIWILTLHRLWLRILSFGPELTIP